MDIYLTLDGFQLMKILIHSNLETKWNITGNNKLTPNNPVSIFYENEQGLRFERIISLDEKYLFKINQKIINKTDKKYKFYPYAYLHRNNIPDDLTDFYILTRRFCNCF